MMALLHYPIEGLRQSVTYDGGIDLRLSRNGRSVA